MFWLGFVALFFVNLQSVEACDNGIIEFDGNLTKCATDPLYFLGDYNCAFFWHDNCGGRRLNKHTFFY
uniref:Uncharacterized protein n=1 Tax=Panagrolaimus sp. PS1159 TaxID=55785 RepID=A0AC35G0K0_9BILA